MRKLLSIVAGVVLLEFAAGVKSAETPEDAVIQQSTQALAANPQDAAAYGQRGAAHIKKKDYAKAVADFTEAIKLNDQKGDFFGGRGDGCRVLGQNDLAVADYTAAIKLNGRHPHYFGMRGNCYMALGKFAEAIADMEKALELKHPSVDYFKSCIAKMQGELNAKLAPGVPSVSAATGLRLAAVFSDHMILQREVPVPVWGWAVAGEQVTVEFAGQKKTAVADVAGKWLVKLDPMPASAEPRTLTVTGSSRVTRGDVLVGDVWLASGQSNMEWVLANTTGAEQEIARSANPQLRHFLVRKNTSAQPLDNTEGQWAVASPQTSGGFTALGYYFAKKLQNELKVPVGLLHASWGGTAIEPWTSDAAIDGVPDMKATRDRLWTDLNNYRTNRQAFVDGLGVWLKETGREDKPAAAAAFAGADVSAAGWVPVKVPGVVKAPGLPEAGAVWLRKEINVTKTGATLSLALPMDGYDSVYWNGRLLKQTTCQDFLGRGHVRRHGAYSILPDAVKLGTNILAIRFFEPVEPAKFTGVPQAGAISLAGEWRAKAEYEFPAVDAAKIAAAPRPPAIVPDAQAVPGSLFNGMIAPVRPYAIRGAIWYQGESNAGNARKYRTIFPLLISDWRQQWAQGEFPFYFCQLANYMAKKSAPAESQWAELREAQSMALKVPHTGQAVLIDIGESEDIHPRNKKDAGERLALNALAQDFGKAIPFSGPVYDTMKVEAGKIALTFKHTDGGLVARPVPATYLVKGQSQETAPLVRNRPGSQLEGFAICGADKRWVWADAKIEGDRVIVWSDQVAAPVAVRYAWAENPTCNLYNGASLPASPFRTD